MINPKTFHNKFLDTASRDAAIDSYYVQRATEQDYDCVAKIKQALDWADSPGCYLFSEDRRWLNLIRQGSGEFAQKIENLEADFSPTIRLFDGYG